MNDQYVDPNPEALDAFLTSHIEGPISMLNLVAFRERAAYADKTISTGAQAYATYSALAAPLFAEAGGEVIWQGMPEGVLIGPSEEAWDTAFIARYPHKGAFAGMVQDERYRAILHHRTAGVRTSRLICLSEPASTAFG
ncbi:MAG: DUF1330 domain-containing protein [Parvularcula sp.]